METSRFKKSRIRSEKYARVSELWRRGLILPEHLAQKKEQGDRKRERKRKIHFEMGAA